MLPSIRARNIRLDERKAQFDLAMKVYKELEHMTYAVAAIEGVRDAANAPRSDQLRDKIRCASNCRNFCRLRRLRSKIVATKEGGMITGEERIRELLGQLYGGVTGYDGKPTDYQVARTESLGHELEDVIDDFQKTTAKRIARDQRRFEEEEIGNDYCACRVGMAEEEG